MRTLPSFLLLLTTAIATSQASTPLLTGRWLLTRVVSGTKVKNPYVILDFAPDSSFSVLDVPYGTWTYRTNDSTLMLQARDTEALSGSCKVLKLSEEQFVFRKDSHTYYCTGVRPEAVSRTNAASDLQGDWQLHGTDYPFAYLRLETPMAFTLVQANSVETDVTSGNWIVQPEENAIVFAGSSHLLRGKAAILERSDSTISLQLGERILRANRSHTERQQIQRLTFEEEEFPENAEPEDLRLPWQEFDRMVETLARIRCLRYSYGKLVNTFGVLRHTSFILARVTVEPQAPRVRFVYFSVTGADTSQFSEAARDELMNHTNAFFPREEPWPYRIAGTEHVTVPAGSFACTVVEGIDGFRKVKLWMINDLPGVYARIIEEQVDPFGTLDYTLSELQAICR